MRSGPATFLPAALVVLGLGAAASRSTRAEVADPTLVAARTCPGRLPAGWWDGRTPTLSDGSSPVASHAVIVGPSTSLGRAQRAAARVPRVARGPGYPWLTMASTVRVEAGQRQVVVVAGYFADLASATRWRRCAALPASKVVVLRPLDPDPPARLVPVLHDAPAYTLEDLTRRFGTVERFEDGTATTSFPSPTVLLASLGAVPASCQVGAGSLHLIGAPERRASGGADPLFLFDRALVPVRCGDRLAYTLRGHTGVEAFLEPVGSQVLVHQVVDVTCDRASWETRPLGPTAAQPQPGPAAPDAPAPGPRLAARPC